MLFFWAVAIAEPKVTYVGDGRYACQGSERECEPINRRNDARELQRLQSQWHDMEQREREKQTELLKRDRASDSRDGRFRQ